MDLGLNNRIALVTGSTHGVGKSIAIALAKEGVNIIINGRNEGEVQKTVKEIRDLGVSAFECCIDARNPNAIKDFFSEIGQLDILVNNVGNIEKPGDFLDLTDEDWLSSHELTFMSVVRFVREALPLLLKSNQPRIINISSIPAHQPGFYNPHYSADKAAMLNLGKYLANSFGKKGILVNTICPSTLHGGGWVKNKLRRADKDRVSLEEMEEIMIKEEAAKSPLGKVGELEDVANLVVYLSSCNAKYLTGHCYNVDGGVTRSI